MPLSFFRLIRRNLVLVALAGGTIAAGLGSTGVKSGVSPSFHHALKKRPASLSWSYIKVDASPGAQTEVMGVNNLAGSTGPQIVGTYFTNGTNPSYNGFTSLAPSYAAITYASYPRSTGAGTQMNAIATQSTASALPILAGWVDEPGVQAGDWAVIDNQGLWSLVKEEGSIGGTNHFAGYLFGLNNSHVAVGYRTTQSSYPNTIAYEVTPPEQFTDVPFPNSWDVRSSIAYGINNGGDMVGTMNIVATNVETSESWYALCETHCSGTGTPTYCFAMLNYGVNTSAYSINDATSGGGHRLIVGSYQNGTTGVIHGFLVSVSITGGTCVTGVLQAPIDETHSHNVTVVHGINNAGYIVGWYNDASLNLHGFVGVPDPSFKRRR